MQEPTANMDLSPEFDSGRALGELLVAHRAQGMDWGELSRLNGRPCSKELANRFLLCCLLDYQMPSNTAWSNGERLIHEILRDPNDLWAAITSVSEPEWQAKRKDYRLHRFPSAHHRLWRIGKLICDRYGGDARRIWDGRDARSALEALWELGAGNQISRMVVGALRDCGQVHGSESDVKGDVYVCRVLGRAMLGDTTDAETAVRLARKLHPDPWQVDSELWNVGNRWCSKRSPNCQHCYLAPHCVYANKQGHEPVKTVAPETGREPPQTSDYAVAGSSSGRAKYLYRLSYDDVEIGTYSWDKADLLAQRIYAARGQDSRGIRIIGAYRDGVVKEWQFSRPRERRLQVLEEEGRELLEQLRRGAIGKRQ